MSTSPLNRTSKDTSVFKDTASLGVMEGSIPSTSANSFKSNPKMKSTLTILLGTMPMLLSLITANYDVAVYTHSIFLIVGMMIFVGADDQDIESDLKNLWLILILVGIIITTFYFNRVI
jgi:hypothetical protein